MYVRSAPHIPPKKEERDFEEGKKRVGGKQGKSVMPTDPQIDGFEVGKEYKQITVHYQQPKDKPK